MKRLLFSLALVGLQSSFSFAQITITSLPFTPSVTDFNSFDPSSAANLSATLPTGWTVASSGTASYRGQGVGTSNFGGYWGYGSSSDFSIGVLRSASVGDVTYSVNFLNTSGTTISFLKFSWDYKQFRFANNSGWDCSGTGALATNSTVDAKDFVGSSSGTNGTPVTTSVSPFTLNGLSIANNATFGLSWISTDSASADNGISIDNFQVQANNTPLPIRISMLQVLSKSASNISFRWQVESSEALRSVVLERSTNGLSFDAVTAIEEINDRVSEESVVDAYPNKGVNIYRLKMVNADGDATYSTSQIVRLETRTIDHAIISPNPCNELLNVSFSPSGQVADIEVLNLFGQSVRKFKSLQSGAGLDFGALPPGQYFLQILQGQEKKILAFTRL